MLRTRIVNADGTTTSRKEGAFQLWNLDDYKEKVILIDVNDLDKTIQIKPLQNDVVLKIINHKETGRRVVVIPVSWRGTKVEIVRIDGTTKTDTNNDIQDTSSGYVDDLNDTLTLSTANVGNADFKKLLIIIGIAVGLVIVVKLIKKK